MDSPYVDFSHYFYLFSLWIISVLVIQHIIKSLIGSKRPPGPRALPILGHIHLLGSGLPLSLQALAAKHGPLMRIRVGSLPVLVVSDAATAKQILKTHDADFASKFVFGPRQHNIYKGAEFFNAPYGPYWRFMKKLSMTKLFAGSQLDRFIHTREDETLAMLRSLIERSREGEPCDLSLDFTSLTSKILSRMVMEKRCKRNPNLPLEIRKIIREIMACGTKFSYMELYGPLKNFDIFGHGKKLGSAIWRYDELIEKILKEYEDDANNQEEEKDEDVVDILLETYKDPNAELKLTGNQIKFFILELFIASLDTTSAALQWTMTELINHPNVLAKLREEINLVMRTTSRLVKESDVPKLPYLQAVIKETARLHPVGPLLRRKSNKDTIINGYNVKTGTNIFINAYAIMRDPNTYKDPDKFLPERFLVTDERTCKQTGCYKQHLLELKGQDVNYLAFGSGRRGCLGASHASLVTNLTIGSLVQCFDWRVAGDEENVSIKLPTGLAGSGFVGRSLVCYPAIRFDPFR